MKKSAIPLLKALTEAHGAPGSEAAVRAIFCREVSGCGELSFDRMGSTICTRHGPDGGPTVMVTAHFDEVGFAVQSITRAGFLRLVALGGWPPQNLPAQRVRILTKSGREIPGVIASTPPHFMPESQRDKLVPLENLLVDVGAGSQEEAVKGFGIRPGDPVVPFSEFTAKANPNLFVAKAFDNRVGCGVMIQCVQELNKRKLPCTLAAVGTVQEEVGCRGAMTAAAAVKPDVAFVLEGTPADDTPGMDASEAQGALGKGVQVRLLDPTAIMHRRLVEFVLKVAEKSRIPHQVAVRKSGGTDARSIQLTEQGVPVVVLGVPTRYIHSHASILDLRDYLSALKLMLSLLPACDASAVRNLHRWV
ncbi:MAG: M42 family metallopeptidase [Verrucomicrobiales bacterium]|nr:M42 family metallopeptidase [Verrucomicrobiales bacterium]